MKLADADRVQESGRFMSLKMILNYKSDSSQKENKNLRLKSDRRSAEQACKSCSKAREVEVEVKEIEERVATDADQQKSLARKRRNLIKKLKSKT